MGVWGAIAYYKVFLVSIIIAGSLLLTYSTKKLQGGNFTMAQLEKYPN
jgi:hypothetical protein